MKGKYKCEIIKPFIKGQKVGDIIYVKKEDAISCEKQGVLKILDIESIKRQEALKKFIKSKKQNTDRTKNVSKPVKQNRVLIFDIETTGTNIEKDKMVFFGAYSYVDNKLYCLNATKESDRKTIQELMQTHNVYVGFRSKFFDIPIIENSGISTKSGDKYKINIDLHEVLKNKLRATIMATPSGDMLSNVIDNYRLDTICEALGFDTPKGKIDYNIFKQESFSGKDLEEIYKYVRIDIELTKKLYEYVMEYFESFKEFVSDWDYQTYKHITTTPGSFTYHAICNMTNTPMEWSDLHEKPENYGGYVLEPQKDYAENVVYFDFSSLYPMIFIQNNLFSSVCKCCKNTQRFHKNELFGLKGSYCSKTQGHIEKLVKSLYLKRKQYKDDNNPKQYAIKIMINSLYGITGSSKFKSIYNYNVSGDCTIIGRAYTEKAIEIFNSKGFNVVYADTDSCFIELGNGSIDEAQKVADLIVSILQETMPFPFKEFEFKIDGRFKKIRFVAKKLYYGVSEENKLKITGLAPVRSDCSLLGKTIFDKIQDKLINSQTLQIPEQTVINMIHKELKSDITICGQNFKITSQTKYKNNTSIQAQIAKEYGEGEHFLIPNKKLGRVGKQKLYCKPELAKKFLKIDDLILDKTINELKPFMEIN